MAIIQDWVYNEHQYAPMILFFLTIWFLADYAERKLLKKQGCWDLQAEGPFEETMEVTESVPEQWARKNSCFFKETPHNIELTSYNFNIEFSKDTSYWVCKNQNVNGRGIESLMYHLNEQKIRNDVLLTENCDELPFEVRLRITRDVLDSINSEVNHVRYFAANRSLNFEFRSGLHGMKGQIVAMLKGLDEFEDRYYSSKVKEVFDQFLRK